MKKRRWREEEGPQGLKKKKGEQPVHSLEWLRITVKLMMAKEQKGHQQQRQAEELVGSLHRLLFLPVDEREREREREETNKQEQ